MIVLWVLIHKKYTLDSYGPVDPLLQGYSSATVTSKLGVSSVTVWLNSC